MAFSDGGKTCFGAYGSLEVKKLNQSWNHQHFAYRGMRALNEVIALDFSVWKQYDMWDRIFGRVSTATVDYAFIEAQVKEVLKVELSI